MGNIFKSFEEDNGSEINQNVKAQNVNQPNMKEFNNFKEKYKGKSDEEILKDAKEYSEKMKKQLGEKEYNKKIQDLKKFEMFLNSEQKRKLNEFLDKLK